MSNPVCPSCGSTAVSPDPSNGGAGRNRCRCGHTGPVRDFHEPVKAEHYKPGDRVTTNGHFGETEEAPRKPRYWWQED